MSVNFTPVIYIDEGWYIRNQLPSCLSRVFTMSTQLRERPMPCGAGSGRIADALLGNQVAFGGLGVTSGWSVSMSNTSQQQCPGPSYSGVFEDRENWAPAPVSGTDCAPCFSAAPGSDMLEQRRLRPVIDKENLPPSYHQLANGAAKLAGAPGSGSQRRRHQQQRKQKLRQRPLQPHRPQLRPRSQASAPVAILNQQQKQPAGSLPFGIFVDEEPSSRPNKAPVSTAAPSLPLQLPPALLMAPSALESALAPGPSSTSVLVSDTPSSSLHSSFESSLSIVAADNVTSQSGMASPADRRSALEHVFEYREYAADAHRIMRVSELKHRAKVGFMARQPDITLTMRTILIDWLVEVNDEYKMAPETLHLAVNYIDRFLSVMTVVRGKLQLVGTTALFIASKFEEIYPPTAVEFVYITDDTYTAQQLRLMEHIMLKMLAFDLAVPTSCWFLSYYCSHAQTPVSDAVKHLAQYLSELCLVQYEICNRYLSSQQAAAALSLALQTSDQAPWSQPLSQLTGYSLADLRPCIEEMLVVFQMARSQPQQAVVDKYASDKYSAVSTVSPPSHCRWH